MSDDGFKSLSWLPDDEHSPFAASTAHRVFPAEIATDPDFGAMLPAPDPSHSGIGTAYGAGRTQLIAQTFDTSEGRYEYSGNQDIDAILIGSRWAVTDLTFSFPTSGDFYTDGTGSFFGNEAASHVTFNAIQQTATRYALSLISAYTNLNFIEITETETTHAALRLSQTDDVNVGSAYGLFPSSRTNSGDIWFGRTGQPFYETPAPGNWGQATIMHELGHTLGLKHGHDDYTDIDLTAGGYLDTPSGGGPRYGSAALPSDHDGQGWSVMTYRTDPAPGGDQFGGEGENQPQTFMQNDIAALQYLYGADFATNAGATVYRWDTTTGEMSINGIGQGAPTANKILMTLWDGNGIDTYDLSNYTNNLSIDLNPGAFSTFSEDQLADHRAINGGGAPAAGNVANALLFNGDARSLIENATGGTGNDLILGNQANNRLVGNDGTDTLAGDIGSDVLLGGRGSDVLYGDGIPAQDPGVGFGIGLVIKPAGAGNNTFAAAIDVSDSFSLAADPDIIAPTTTPHVTISGTGDGNRDYYKIFVNSGTILTFDIDSTTNIDSLIKLYDANGNLIDYNDDSDTSDGAGGSSTIYDSFLTYTVATTGYYVIEVGDYRDAGVNEPIASGATYELQISAAGTPASNGGSGNDTLDGGLGADRMYGGAGNDIYAVDMLGDRVFEAADAGTDRVNASASYVLQAGQSIETLALANAAGTASLYLTGNELGQRLLGNAGYNRLDGGGGADRLYGFAGDDVYIVDNSGDRVFEAAGEGTDTVYAGASYVLQAGQSVETLRTASVADTTTQALTGNEFGQTLLGNAGYNRLDGGGGSDKLYGYCGNDVYLVDHEGDLVFEVAGQGTDTVYASLTYVLQAGQSVETLRTVAVADTTTQGLTGNEFGQTLLGNAGYNRLDGGGGADKLYGYGGNDVYIVDDAEDRVFEVAGEGTDTVYASVSYALAAGQSIETLRSASPTSNAAQDLTGNEFSQRLLGNAGANLIDGGGGIDTLYGYGGADTFRFSSAFSRSNIDHIADFSTADDTIQLDRSNFTRLALGGLSGEAYKEISASGAVIDADDRILYDRDSGALFYDSNGSAAGGRYQFAVLDNRPATLSAADFFVVA